MFSWLKKPSTGQKPTPSSDGVSGKMAGQTLGQLGEEFAQKEYQNRGFKIIAANEFNRKGKRLGEIDFIAADKKKIVFVEVKTRSLAGSKFGQAAEAVNIFKQHKILKAVKIFLLKNTQYRSLRPQIDVCVLEFEPVDKIFRPAKILANAVEDWS